MRITTSITIVIFLLFAPILQAQYCGTSFINYPNELLKELNEFKKTNKKDKNAIIDSIGISIHIVETVQGNSGIDIVSLSKEIDIVNQLFRTANIYFFLCGSARYITGEETYDFNSGDNLNRSYHIANTINIFYADIVTDHTGNQLCGYAQFPWVGKHSQRYIMMSKSCQDNGSTLAHELGHYFGLLHTHESAWGAELVDGSNCSTAGDLLCDTPADPGLGPGNMNGCSYVGQQTDQLGNLYVPRTDNIMSYALSHCRRRFSTEQTDIILFFYETEYSEFFSICDFYPDLSIQLNEPFNPIKSGERVLLNLNLKATGLDEAFDIPVHFYLSDNMEQRGQIIETKNYFIDQGALSLSEEIIINFPLNRNTGRYYLTAVIDPEDRIYEQSEFNNQQKIIIDVDNSSFQDAVLYPNPIINKFRIFIRDTRLKGNITVNIFNQLGQIKLRTDSFKKGDEYFIELDASNLDHGLYFCQLYFEDKKSVMSFPFVKL